MIGLKSRALILRVLSLSIICMGFAQVAPAGVISTGLLVENEVRTASLSRMEILLAREDVSRQLAELGVDQKQIVERLNALTTEELLALEGQIDEQIAGGDLLAVIGIVFVVLLILELVGVTDVFKSI